MAGNSHKRSINVANEVNLELHIVSKVITHKISFILNNLKNRLHIDGLGFKIKGSHKDYEYDIET
jgi:hypothetical protein